MNDLIDYEIRGGTCSYCGRNADYMEDSLGKGRYYCESCDFYNDYLANSPDEDPLYNDYLENGLDDDALLVIPIDDESGYV